MAKKFYLTTTLPYVNADPHIGFALELVHADIIARYHTLQGEEVFFNTGTDEHGLKIYRNATAVGKDPQTYVDEYAAKFRRLPEALGVMPEVHFIRTTDTKHKAAAQEFWRRCERAGDIYKKNYKIKYCVGCELEKSDSELVNGRCPIHPNLELEFIEEENYFFRFSKYQKDLLKLYADRPDFVVPNFRFNEIKKFVEAGLEDFSISRLKEKMPWGVSVPGDDTQVMYVWFDALVDYISTIDWPQDETSFKKWWVDTGGVVQFAGKDQIRQQAAMWQAMLLSAGLPPSKQIVIHGFITSEGQKMSKSLGNVIDPFALIDEYGVDAVRYFLARHINPFEDSDFTLERFKEAYNANLANGLGNLASRVMTMSAEHLPDTSTVPEHALPEEFKNAFEHFNVQEAAEVLWQWIGKVDARIAETEPYKLVKENPAKAKEIITECVSDLRTICRMLRPLLPSTCEKLEAAILANKKPENLFPRKD
ncbi:MAG TPA: methionine--tRNA ligase [Candidatus Paceibacterota bacterium]